MTKNPGIKFGDDIQIRKQTDDGAIWLPARVVWLGHATFKVESPGSVVRRFEYAEQDQTWRLI